MKKKRKYKKKRILLASIIFLILISIIVLTINKVFQKPTSTSKLPEQIKEVIEEPKDQTYKLSLIMVGDALIHDDIYIDAKTNNGYDFKPMLSLIKDKVSNYDLAYYNQETILGGTEIGLSSYPAFNSPYEVGDAFIDAGFNLVSLATNHTIDRGETAVINSKNYWNKHQNVLATGSYTSQEERNIERILTKNNISYTMLNYTYGTNGIKLPTGKDYLVNIWPVTGNNPNTDTAYQNYKETVRKDIESIRDKVDLLMVAMHWGVEYQLTPNSYQKDMAQYLANLGVDIIIGTHPHVIQPIEWIDNTLVIYSLGNFISAHEVINMDNRVGLMSSIDITKTISTDNNISIKLDNLNNELLYTYYNNYKNFKVIPFSKLTEEYLKDYQSISTKYINIIKSIDNTIPVNTFN